MSTNPLPQAHKPSTNRLSLYHLIKSGSLKVYPTSPIEERFWSKVDKDGPIHLVHGQCWRWTGWKNGQGYGYIFHKGEDCKAHRVAYALLVDEVPSEMMVLHKCDNPECTNPEHLFLGTALDNTRDSASKGRMAKKLTENDVRQIRSRYAKKGKRNTTKVLAQEFGVAVSTIRCVILHKTWKHVK